VLTWKELGKERFFQSCELETSNGVACLVIRYDRFRTFQERVVLDLADKRSAKFPEGGLPRGTF